MTVWEAVAGHLASTGTDCKIRFLADADWSLVVAVVSNEWVGGLVGKQCSKWQHSKQQCHLVMLLVKAGLDYVGGLVGKFQWKWKW